MSELLELIKSRRSIRKFLPNAIEQDVLEKIVEAGRWAPTGGNSQTVHFTVIRDQAILEELRIAVRDAFASMELKEDMYGSMKNSIRASQSGNYIYDYNAPVLVVISNKKGYPNGLADCGCVLENMMLEATEEGIGSCWINQLHWLDEEDTVRQILAKCGIYDEETICGAVALGKYELKLNQIERKGMEVTWI